MDNFMRNILLEEILNDPVDNIDNLLNQYPIQGMNNIMNDLNEVMFAFEDDGADGLRINPRNNGLVGVPNYFEDVIPLYTDNQFYSHFRMSRESIAELENIIRPHVLDVNHNMPLQKKILLTIWILATPESFRSVADRFGLCKTITYSAFKEIVHILANLLPQFVRWPDAQECEVIEAGFRSRREAFPGIIGAIDGCHIEIIQPPGNANDYYNRKGTHSIILQGTCDHNGKFIDVLIGRPGRAHDASVFRTSTLYNQHILGDSAYPLMLNVLTPFKDNGHLSPQQIRYNVKHASIRSIIERAFGLLKGKFRRLRYLDVKSVDMGIVVISVACTLHNFLLSRGDANIGDFTELEAEVEENQDANLDAIKKRFNIMNSF
ncbi:putative nuclease HARBI1 isoform X2 [Pieris napi]|uniref:putative nuclease HARBI1 isoform X2 n=1 Tax=Pieris napi TaxID=78633 RepID=UPI001FBBAB28|nr:putative nuclease HARBI1 isoform X2 [Pieris napi]